jgi:4'-phosphopantetheinyl transferase
MTHPCGDHRLGLSDGDVHVWTAHVGEGDRAAADWWRILDRQERTRAAQFSFERDRLRFIEAHGIVRRILAEYCDADAATLIFARNRHGKPSLVPRTKGPHLQFSVSHSGNCCMLAVALERSIGIDVEKVRDLPQAIDIAQGYFTPAEAGALAVLPGTVRRDAFFALWTHKEAMVKALGVGLATNLARVEFDLDERGELRLAAWNGDRSVARKWSTFRLDAAPGYVAAIASVYRIRSLTLQNWNRNGAV